MIVFASQAPLKPGNLQVNYCISPMGIDDQTPRLSWNVNDNDRAEFQSAYEIIVATNLNAIQNSKGDAWSSGKIVSNRQTGVEYSGIPLTSQTQYWWKVRTYDKDDQQGDWSDIATFETGMYNRTDWKAKLISDTIKMARIEFNLPKRKTISKARAYITSDGYYELRVNGNKIGNHVIDPLATEVDKLLLYNTFDITHHLKNGKTNAAGIMLGGFVLQKRSEKVKVFCQIEVWFTDGTKQTITSDESWKVLDKGPVISQHIFDGEKYDAREELPGWDKPGYNDTGWFKPVTDEMPQNLSIKAQLNPIKISEEITPVALFSPNPGTYIFDMGKNISGWAELKVKGKVGTKVTMRFAERIYPDSTLDITTNSASQHQLHAEATDTYTLKGIGTEVWEPRFTYHGFRFVELTGYPGIPDINTLKAKFFHSDFSGTVAEFNCSNPDLVALAEAYKITQVDNLMGLPTDCNQRGERSGWMDNWLTSESAMTYFNAFALYEKWLHDIEVNERKDGSAHTIVPGGGVSDDVLWGSAAVFVPWDFYNLTGDKAYLSKLYPRCKRFAEWYKRLDENGNFIFEPEVEGLKKSGTKREAFRHNDWNPVGGNGVELKPSKNYMATGFYYRVMDIMSKMAMVLGKIDDYQNYTNLAANIKDVLNKNFLNTGYYDVNIQTGNAVAIDFGIVPPASLDKVFNDFAADIYHDGDPQLKTGSFGTYSLMRALGEYNLNDLAYKLVARKEYPGWGYMINEPYCPGTLWESWENEDNSKNHVFLGGSMATWLIYHAAGIKPIKPGYEEIQFKPAVTNFLNHASAVLHTVKGTVESSWEKSNGKLSWGLTVPANSKGFLYIPTFGAKNSVKITEGSATIWDKNEKDKVDGLQYVKTEGDYQIWSVGSGSYRFEILLLSTP